MFKNVKKNELNLVLQYSGIDFRPLFLNTGNKCCTKQNIVKSTSEMRKYFILYALE